MGSKFSKKKHTYDLEQSTKGKKKSKKSGRLNRRWKSVDVYTQTGENEKNLKEIAPRVKAAMSMDDLSRDTTVDLTDKQSRPNGSHRRDYSSSSNSSDSGNDKKRKKKKKKVKKSKDKNNKNNVNEKKKTSKPQDEIDEMEETKVINASDVSDVEFRHSSPIMVTNPVYMASGLPQEHRIRHSSSSSEQGTKQPSGQDLANEILEVVSSAQLIQDLEESREIENLPEPPPLPSREKETFRETYEGLAKAQLKVRFSTSNSSSSDTELEIDRQIPPITNDSAADDAEILYENAILKVNRNESVVVVPIPDRDPEPQTRFYRKLSRSSSSSSSSSSDSNVEKPAVLKPEELFHEDKPELQDPTFHDVLIATTIEENLEPEDFDQEAEVCDFEEVDLNIREGSPEPPEKPPRLLRRSSATSSSSSSADEGELIVAAETPQPPSPPAEPVETSPVPSPEPEPEEDDSVPDPLVEYQPVLATEINDMAQIISAAVVEDTVETIRVQAVLLAPRSPEPVPDNNEVVPEPPEEFRQVPSRKSSTSSSSSSSSSSSDSD